MPSPGSIACNLRVGPSRRSGERARELDGVIARGDLAREARLLEALDQGAEPRAGVDPELAGEVVTADERALGEEVLAAQRLAEHLVGELEVARDRDVGLAAAGGEPVGHA